MSLSESATLNNGKPVDPAFDRRVERMRREMDGDPWPPEDDYAIPFADDDQVIECGCDDPDFGEPEGWPSWTDAHWYEATQDDIEFLNRNAYPVVPGEPIEPWTPSAQDWSDYESFCREVDQRHELARTERLEDECRTRYGA